MDFEAEVAVISTTEQQSEGVTSTRIVREGRREGDREGGCRKWEFGDAGRERAEG